MEITTRCEVCGAEFYARSSRDMGFCPACGQSLLFTAPVDPAKRKAVRPKGAMDEQSFKPYAFLQTAECTCGQSFLVGVDDKPNWCAFCGRHLQRNADLQLTHMPKDVRIMGLGDPNAEVLTIVVLHKELERARLLLRKEI